MLVGFSLFIYLPCSDCSIMWAASSNMSPSQQSATNSFWSLRIGGSKSWGEIPRSLWTKILDPDSIKSRMTSQGVGDWITAKWSGVLPKQSWREQQQQEKMEDYTFETWRLLFPPIHSNWNFGNLEWVWYFHFHYYLFEFTAISPLAPCWSSKTTGVERPREAARNIGGRVIRWDEV